MSCKICNRSSCWIKSLLERLLSEFFRGIKHFLFILGSKVVRCITLIVSASIGLRQSVIVKSLKGFLNCILFLNHLFSLFQFGSSLKSISTLWVGVERAFLLCLWLNSSVNFSIWFKSLWLRFWWNSTFFVYACCWWFRCGLKCFSSWLLSLCRFCSSPCACWFLKVWSSLSKWILSIHYVGCLWWLFHCLLRSLSILVRF